MIRRVFCNIVFVVEFVLLYLFFYYLFELIFKNDNSNSDELGYVFNFLIINLLFLVPAILLYGTPNNVHKKKIRVMSYKDITDNINFTFCAKKESKKKYSLVYRGKTYYFEFKYWFNARKRLIDYVLIQFHNNYCKGKGIKYKHYYKNFFKKNKPLIKIIDLKGKEKIYKFKPSFMLLLKKILSYQWFPRTKFFESEPRRDNEVWNGDIGKTYWL